ETISELFSPGSPNKLMLDILHTTTAILTVGFGVGILRFVLSSEDSSPAVIIAASLIILMGLVNILTATLFPQDAWNTDPTFQGEMHKILAGVLALLSIVSTLMFGIWFQRTGFFPHFGIYSFVTVALLIITGGFAVTKLGSPIMGLTERITILAGLQWTFVLALKLFTM
ncbi:MAG: DUF998 domain-containing protein, partial [Anaerolineales bacterium]